MNVAKPHQGRHVGFVRLRSQRVTEEEHRETLLLRDPGPDQLVTAQWAAEHTFYGQPGLLLQNTSGGSGGDQMKLPQCFPVFQHEQRQFQLLLVVGDQRHLTVSGGLVSGSLGHG